MINELQDYSGLQVDCTTGRLMLSADVTGVNEAVKPTITNQLFSISQWLTATTGSSSLATIHSTRPIRSSFTSSAPTNG